MHPLEWVNCPECGKKLCRISTNPNNNPEITLLLWCRQCKKEVEVKAGNHNKNKFIKP